jgi:hypothetical protein
MLALVLVQVCCVCRCIRSNTSMIYFPILSYPLKSLEKDSHERQTHQRFGHVRWTFALRDGGVIEQLCFGCRRHGAETVRRSLRLPQPDWFVQRLANARVLLSSTVDAVLLVGVVGVRWRGRLESTLTELSDEEALQSEFMRWPSDMYTGAIAKAWFFVESPAIHYMMPRSVRTIRRYVNNFNERCGTQPCASHAGLRRCSGLV